MAPNVPGSTFWDHLGALRTHLIAAGLCFGISFLGLLLFLGPLIRLVTAPLAPHPLIFLSPLGPLAFQMRVATR